MSVVKQVLTGTPACLQPFQCMGLGDVERQQLNLGPEHQGSQIHCG